VSVFVRRRLGVIEVSILDIAELLRQASIADVSDIHISAGARPMFRIHGLLCAAQAHVLEPSDTEQLIRSLLTKDQFLRLQDTGDVDCSYTLSGVSRYRVNAYKERGCYGVAIRVVPESVPKFESLGLPPVLQKFVEKSQGLVLVTGPTGHGKSTTLATLVDVINRTHSRHIVTLEDPIEYLHRHQRAVVHQREIGVDTSSFADGLRAALRQDPDVIVIGEMRDLDTIHTAITAAETGHLVLATLHTRSASQTVERIIDVFPAHQQAQIRIQLASVLIGIVNQRLLPRTSGDGRVAACEVLINTPAVGNLIRTQKVHQLQTVMQTSTAEGMQTMDASLHQLLKRGLIDQHRAAAAQLSISQGMLQD
jgi:twitching motility protein PilT